MNPNQMSMICTFGDYARTYEYGVLTGVLLGAVFGVWVARKWYRKKAST